MEALLQLPTVDIQLRVSVEGEGEGEGNNNNIIVLSCKYSAPGLAAVEAAAQAGAGEIVSLLLAAKPGLHCDRAWFLAAAEGHLNVLQILSRHGVEQDIRDEQGRTALCHAVLSSQQETVRSV